MPVLDIAWQIPHQPRVSRSRYDVSTGHVAADTTSVPNISKQIRRQYRTSWSGCEGELPLLVPRALGFRARGAVHSSLEHHSALVAAYSRSVPDIASHARRQVAPSAGSVPDSQ
eukprot:382405-Rhodomonas_salina.2